MEKQTKQVPTNRALGQRKDDEYLSLPEILRKLRQDLIVTVPTETVEGYAVLLSSEKGVLELMRFKERGFDSGKVFTLVPQSRNEISRYAMIPEIAREIIAKNLPGELTVILPKNPNFHHFYFDHFEKIGFRIPDHALFRELLPLSGPLLLTSANVRGEAPKSLTGHLPSTVIDFSFDEPKILRQGNLKVRL